MTPQEAKARLERIWKDYTSAYDTISEDDVTAFDMAISALQEQDLQPTCNQLATDTISRQAAIDVIEFGITYAKAINKETGEVKELFQASNDELRKAADRIKQLPSVQPEQNTGKSIIKSDKKIGRWLDRWEDGQNYYECSECGHETGLCNDYNYCPNCGAKMGRVIRMSNSEALDILQKELECRNEEESCVGILCKDCEHNVTYDDVTKAINVAIEAVEFCVMVEDDGK